MQLSLARAEEQRKRAEDEAKKSRTLNSQVSTFSQTETELRSQLNIYVEKFKQVGLPLLTLFLALSLCLPLLSPSDSKRSAAVVGVPTSVMHHHHHHIGGCWTDDLPRCHVAVKHPDLFCI